jgi:hypothetical protein
MGKGRESHAIVAVGCNILIVVGSRLANLAATGEVYDIKHDVWTPLSNLNEGRYYCSLVAINKRFVYCIGGVHQQRGIRSSIEKFDTYALSSEWEEI